jgi:hypothetical protein
VINYDFYWNSIRLIQRAERVDRIGSRHEVIKILNFLPDPIIENINEEDVYAIYRNEESILDKEDENNALEPPEFEKIITDLQAKHPKFWEHFLKYQDPKLVSTFCNSSLGFP